MSSDDRVWVTGVGVATPLGGDVPSTMARLFAGEHGVGPLTLFALPGARSTLAGEVRDLRETSPASRTDSLALQAAREALASAGVSGAARGGIDLCVGGTTAGMLETEELLTTLDLASLSDADGVRLRTHPLSSTADSLHAELGPFGMTRTLCCACTSGVAAIAVAVAWLRAGRRSVLAGGADALCRLTYSGFGALGVLSPASCQPFDAGRSGLNLGEGAGFLLLERSDFARSQGRRPLAEIVGVALGGEAHHITNPEPSGRAAARIMRSAIASAGLEPCEIGYVNAHGTATSLNDSAEAAAIRACFGDHRVPVSSSKGQLGHTLGAAGAIEAVIATKAVELATLPPTVGLVRPDPACDVDHVLEARRLERPPVVLSNSFGFGGTGGSVVVAPPGAGHPVVRSVSSLVLSGAAVVACGRLLAEPRSLAELLIASPGDARELEPVAPGADPTSGLDATRSRRMDRAGRLACTVAEAALAQADRAELPVDRESVAAFSGTAFGNVDGSMRFMKRVLTKGANLASPADFPNLVPSSPISHAAIYLGLGGPAIATPDLSTTAESAIATGLDFVQSGLSGAALCGSVEEVSELAEKLLAPLLGVRPLSAHGEGASAVLIEPAERASQRGAAPLAIVSSWASARGPTIALPSFVPDAVVVSEPGVDLAAITAGTDWARAPRLTTRPDLEDHVGMGGVALAAAAGLVSTGRVRAALVLGAAPDRTYAFLLSTPTGRQDLPG